MNRTRQDQSLDSSSRVSPYDNGLPLANKIQQLHIATLENIISMLCQLLRQFTNVLEQEEIMLGEKQLSNKTIIAIKEANNELKYHQKINSFAHSKSTTNEIELTVQMLTKFRILINERTLPKIKRGQDGHFSQLSTITQKQSQQNLLGNYLRKHNSKTKKSKSNIHKGSFLYNASSIQDLQFQVIRQQTRKSLQNPYHKNNPNRKPLYSDLQRMKGQDSLLPSVRTYLDKHKKTYTSKLPQYQIQKMI